MNCAANAPHRSAWRLSRKPVAETPSARPLTCSLGAGAYRNRIAWIESLTLRALRSHVRDGLVLGLAYAPEAAADVRKMVEQERICCAFLAFDLKEESDCIRVTVTVPEAARASADMLFGHFLAERPAAGN
jgi:hypothetical protein